jgi:hypothetical protein
MRWILGLVVLLLVLLVAGTASLVVFGSGSEVEGGPGDVVGALPGDTVGLPEPVAAMRRQLLDAAGAGDHDRLAELASDDFSYTFGGAAEGGPAAFWRAEEERGHEPLAALVAILRLPYALSGGLYVWPFAHAADPAGLTEYERGLLEEIPGDGEIGGEGYLGWRTGIDPDGTWRFFVAGD